MLVSLSRRRSRVQIPSAPPRHIRNPLAVSHRAGKMEYILPRLLFRRGEPRKAVYLKQRSALKTIRNTLITVLVLILLIGGGGVAYVYFSGNSIDNQTASEPQAAEKLSLPTPSKPNPDAPVGVSVAGLTTPVKPGANSSITIRTTATATCTIKVVHGELGNETAAKDSGLTPKTADDFGSATWSWTMDESAAIGKWTAKVTCKYGKKSGYVEGYIEVKDKPDQPAGASD